MNRRRERRPRCLRKVTSALFVTKTSAICLSLLGITAQQDFWCVVNNQKTHQWITYSLRYHFLKKYYLLLFYIAIYRVTGIMVAVTRFFNAHVVTEWYTRPSCVGWIWATLLQLQLSGHHLTVMDYALVDSPRKTWEIKETFFLRLGPFYHVILRTIVCHWKQCSPHFTNLEATGNCGTHTKEKKKHADSRTAMSKVDTSIDCFQGSA